MVKHILELIDAELNRLQQMVVKYTIADYSGWVELAFKLSSDKESLTVPFLVTKHPIDLPYIGFNVIEQCIESDKSPDCSNLNEPFPAAAENNVRALFNFIRAADCLDLCSVKTSKSDFVIPKGESLKIPCRVNHSPVDQRVPVLFEPEETAPRSSSLMFSDILLSVKPEKSGQIYVQAVNTTEHDIILPNRTLTGRLQLVKSITLVDVKLRKENQLISQSSLQQEQQYNRTAGKLVNYHNTSKISVW